VCPYFAPFAQDTDASRKYCEESVETRQEVDSCPSNEEETKIAAKKKNCEAIAHKQTCSNSSKFKYHCVMDELETSLLEVCAPEYIILGMIIFH
jgi:uncharacterized Fe-S cluster-containing protein